MIVRDTLGVAARAAHAASLWLLGLAALAALGATTLAALGVLPWLGLDATWGGAPVPDAGMWAQIGLTALLWLLLAFFPSSSRVLGLERSHRDFRMTMEDVSRAYHAAHVADRKGAFTLSQQFDEVRERLEYLRDHPDLKLLEADVLTVAAQMGQQSHRLAVAYADDKLARAKAFLAERQQEAEDQARRVADALAIAREVLRWQGRVELEEAMVASRLEQLDEQLQAVLPALGYSVSRDAAAAPRAANVVPLAAE